MLFGHQTNGTGTQIKFGIAFQMCILDLYFGEDYYCWHVGLNQVFISLLCGLLGCLHTLYSNVLLFILRFRL